MIGIYEDIQKKQSDVTHLPCFPYLFSIQVNWVPGSDSRRDRHCVVPFSMLWMSRGSERWTIHNVTDCCPLQPKYLLHSVLERMAHCRVQHRQFSLSLCRPIRLYHYFRRALQCVLTYTVQKLDTALKTLKDHKLLHIAIFNPLNPELNPICYLLALLAHHFLHVSRIMVKSLPLRLLMSYIYIYIYGAPILDVSRSHTTTQHSR